MIRVRDRYFMNIARTVRQGSKCRRAQFGSVLVRPENGRIVATAYNGKPAGACNDGVCYREGLPPNAPKRNCCVHSEKNAIIFSSPEERQGAWMYVTGMPCEDCSLDLMQSGIVRLVYLAVEDGSHPGWVGAPIEQLFEEYGFRGGGTFQRQIEVVRYTDSEWKRLYGSDPKQEFTDLPPAEDEDSDDDGAIGIVCPEVVEEPSRQIARVWNEQMTADTLGQSELARWLREAREKRFASEPE